MVRTEGERTQASQPPRERGGKFSPRVQLFFTPEEERPLGGSGKRRNRLVLVSYGERLDKKKKKKDWTVQVLQQEEKKKHIKANSGEGLHGGRRNSHQGSFQKVANKRSGRAGKKGNDEKIVVLEYRISPRGER